MVWLPKAWKIIECGWGSEQLKIVGENRNIKRASSLFRRRLGTIIILVRISDKNEEEVSDYIWQYDERN